MRNISNRVFVMPVLVLSQVLSIAVAFGKGAAVFTVRYFRNLVELFSFRSLLTCKSFTSSFGGMQS
jgi:hypothetical protein